MTVELFKCDHCKQDKYPGQLQSDERGGLICDTCAKKDHGERQEMKREQARGTAWNGGRGWVRFFCLKTYS